MSGQANVTRTILTKDNIVPRNVFGSFFLLIEEVVFRLECADPRDKVYGILSLIDWGDVAPPSPDYTQSDLQVAVEFMRALARLWKAGCKDGSLWACLMTTIRMLDLDFGSRGLVEALEARRGPPEDCGTGPTVPWDDELTPLRASRTTAWQLLDEDIEANGPKLQSMQTSPPAYRSGTFFLPRWARAGDWAIVMERLLWARNKWLRSGIGELIRRQRTHHSS